MLCTVENNHKEFSYFNSYPHVLTPNGDVYCPEITGNKKMKMRIQNGTKQASLYTKNMYSNGARKRKVLSLPSLMLCVFNGINEYETVIRPVYKDGNKENVNIDNICCDNDEVLGDIKRIDNYGLCFDYYISNAGIVYKKNIDSTYKRVSMFECKRSGHMLVGLSTKRGKIQKPKQFLIARLVMEFFFTGWTPRRHFLYRNGNRNDCSLKNLEWKWGFNGDIDYDYLRNIDTCRLNYENRLAVEYLLTKKESKLYELIKTTRGYMYRVCFNWGAARHFNDVLDNVFEKTKKMLDDGRFMPNTDSGIVAPMAKMVQDYSIMLCRNRTISINTYEKNNTIDSSLSRIASIDIDLYGDGIILDNCLCIEEEISEMFNNLS